MKPVLRVLMVDDSEDDTQLLVSELARSQYEIVYERVATPEALRGTLHRQTWDILLCDLAMPQFSGEMALGIVKKHHPDLPFIFVSGSPDKEVAFRCMKAGAHDYVMKNNLSRLIPAMERRLRVAEMRRQECETKARRVPGHIFVPGRERILSDLAKLPLVLKRILVEEKAHVPGVELETTEGKQGLQTLAKDAIFVCDQDDRITYWNLGAEARYGWRQDEALGKHASLFLQTIFPQPLEEIEATLVEEGYWQGELKHVTRDGRRIMVASRWSLQRDEEGNRAGLLEINSDITERKRAERTLRENEREAYVSTQSLIQLIWTSQPDGRCDYLSDHWNDYTGIPATRPIADVWAEPLHPDDRLRVQTAWIEALETGNDFEIDCRIRRADGVYRRFKTRAVAIRNSVDQTVKWLGTSTEIENLLQSDERARQLDTALDRLQGRTAQLEATNKELESFSHSVSHDLQAPLRSIDGFSRILLKDCADKLDDNGRHNLQRVLAATQRMGLLIDDLLQLSRVTRSEFYLTRVDLSAMARTVASELLESEPSRQVEFIIQPVVAAPQADGHLLRIVIENLLRNSWKFTSKHRAAKIEFGTSERDGILVYYVRDNGVGFDMVYAHKLFGAFQRLHSVGDFPGTGIGLTIVQRIVHRHGGRVWAEGELDKGAIFYFTLLD
jgi:PAS domain S-box-containing protein